MLKKIIVINLLFMSIFLRAVMNHKIEFINAESEPINKKLDEYMQALTNTNRFSGCVLVAKGNKILLNKGYGLANREWNIPNDPLTKFRICSVSKMLTAVAVLQLHDKKLLDINDTIEKYIPDFPQAKEITIHHLLTHSSGLTSVRTPIELSVLPTCLEKTIDQLKSKSLDFTPGSNFKYSNGGYCVLAYIIEKVSGKKYEAYINEFICKNYYQQFDYEILPNSATGYTRNVTDKIVQGDYAYMSNFSGAGGICTTTFDLYKFACSLNSGYLLDSKTSQLMFNVYQKQANYGYGCSIEELEGHKTILHNGGSSCGFNSSLSIFPEDDIYIVILSNFLSSWTFEARKALFSILIDKPYDMPNVNKIQMDSANYKNYTGCYDHPDYKNGYNISTRDTGLFTSENFELIPVSADQFVVSNHKHLLYKFIRDENNNIVQLRIKGGNKYFELRCDKLKDINVS